MIFFIFYFVLAKEKSKNHLTPPPSKKKKAGERELHLFWQYLVLPNRLLKILNTITIQYTHVKQVEFYEIDFNSIYFK